MPEPTALPPRSHRILHRHPVRSGFDGRLPRLQPMPYDAVGARFSRGPVGRHMDARYVGPLGRTEAPQREDGLVAEELSGCKTGRVRATEIDERSTIIPKGARSHSVEGRGEVGGAQSSATYSLLQGVGDVKSLGEIGGKRARSSHAPRSRTQRPDSRLSTTRLVRRAAVEETSSGRDRKACPTCCCLRAHQTARNGTCIGRTGTSAVISGTRADTAPQRRRPAPYTPAPQQRRPAPRRRDGATGARFSRRARRLLRSGRGARCSARRARRRTARG
ncbi:hypothetical protein SAMN05880568_0944 [Microbacterium sp. RURRCA19A]|nr:hypothetical protein SAMN05880568_0944 [Microbacterium sp. RURRCA19A]